MLDPGRVGAIGPGPYASDEPRLNLSGAVRPGTLWPDATARARPWFWGVMDTDSRLVAGLARDLDGTFEELVLAHQDRLFSIALRVLGDRGAAEEAAQDAFVRAYRALAGYDSARIGEIRLRPWLATIVLNLCRTRRSRRAAAGRPPLSLDLEGPSLPEPAASDASTSPVAVSERRAERDRWAGLLATLPPAYRAAVVLRHVDGLSYPDLALALGRPEGTVKAQVHRGLAMLRTALATTDSPERQEMTA